MRSDKVLTVASLWMIGATLEAHDVPRFSDWSAPVNLGTAINSTANDQHPTISKNGRTLIFISNRSDTLGDFDLYVSQRDSSKDPWKPAVNLTVLNTEFREFAPELTNDGHWLYFHSNRPGGCGNQDVWVAHRKKKRDDFDWETPINLGCILNTAAEDAGPTVFQDPISGVFSLYLNRNFNPADLEGPDIYVSTCPADLAHCNRDQLWSAATLVPELSSPFRDTRTAIRRRDGLEMILTSSRGGGCGSQDLWVSTRPTTTAAWSIPVNLDPTDPATGKPTCVTNSTALDGAMAISWNATTLFFFSNRPGGSGGNDLWVSTRRKER